MILNSNSLIKEIYQRLDEYSLVVQYDRDAGDSAYRSALFAILLKLNNHPQAKEYYDVMLHHLQISPGIFIRTPTENFWGSNPNNLSRDQAEKILLAAYLFQDQQTYDTWYNKMYHRQEELIEITPHGKLLSLINKIIPFHQNVHPGTDAPPEFRKIPDLIGINEITNRIRAKHKWYLYPVLMLLDFSYIIGVPLRRYNEWDGDSRTVIDLIYANEIYPTPLSYLAKLIYKHTDYIERIRNNYSDENNGIKPLGELYILICRKYINNEF